MKDFSSLVTAAMPKLRARALSLTRNPDAADDLVQDTVLKALSKQHQFQTGSNLDAWLMTIMRNHFLSQLRKDGREVDDSEGLILANAEAGGLDVIEADEARKLIALVGRLPEDQAEAIRDIADGLSYEESAEKHGVAVGTIKSRVSRARDTLKNWSERHEVGEEVRDDYRAIAGIPINGLSPNGIRSKRPRFIDVKPSQLIVETKYQRDLSAKSMKLIRRIVETFDWTKFKAPVCVEHGDRYFVIDGQHTAIGAASHPEIETIPIMIVDAASVEARASSFVAHNKDRVAMSPYQVFHGEVAAGQPDAVEISRIVTEAGGEIPRNPPARGRYKIGQVSAISELYKMFRLQGPEILQQVLAIAIEARCRPVSKTIMVGLRLVLAQPQFEGISRDDLVTALLARPDIDVAAQRFGAETNQSTYNAAAVLLYRAAASISTRAA